MFSFSTLRVRQLSKATCIPTHPQSTSAIKLAVLFPHTHTPFAIIPTRPQCSSLPRAGWLLPAPCPRQCFRAVFNPPKPALHLAGCCHLKPTHISELSKWQAAPKLQTVTPSSEDSRNKQKIVFWHPFIEHKKQNQSTAKEFDKNKSQNMLESKDAKTHLQAI